MKIATKKLSRHTCPGLHSVANKRNNVIKNQYILLYRHQIKIVYVSVIQVLKRTLLYLFEVLYETENNAPLNIWSLTNVYIRYLAFVRSFYSLMMSNQFKSVVHIEYVARTRLAYREKKENKNETNNPSHPSANNLAGVCCKILFQVAQPKLLLTQAHVITARVCVIGLSIPIKCDHGLLKQLHVEHLHYGLTR